MTKREEMEATANRLATEVALLQKVLQCLVNDERRHTERFNISGNSYKLCLYRAGSPDGGLLTITHWNRDQVAHTAAYYFEDYWTDVILLRSTDPVTVALRIALDRLGDKQKMELGTCVR